MPIDIIKRLQETSSTNEKIQILTENSGNDLLKRVIVAALDPNINYFIKKIPEHDSGGSKDIEFFLNNLSLFSERRLTGHAAIEHMSVLLSSLTVEAAELAIKIIRRDLRCGVQESTVNKVWKDLIPEFPCMLAQPSKDKYLKRIKYPAMSQIKSDGTRATAACIDGEVTIFSRQGKEIPIHHMLDADILAIASRQGVPFMLDGELVVLDEHGKILPRKTGNGIINKAIKGTITVAEASRIRMQCWDIIPIDDFYAGHCKITYGERFKRVQEVCDGKLEPIETRMVKSLDDAMEHFNEVREAGFEGTILKNIDSPWENKRSNNLVKLKAEEEADLEIIGFNYGNPGTKWEKSLGSLICASSDRMVVVDVSGFEDDLREEIFRNFEEEWFGSIITVLYNERIKSKGDKPTSLFLPRFVCKRFDKSVANSNDEIK